MALRQNERMKGRRNLLMAAGIAATLAIIGASVALRAGDDGAPVASPSAGCEALLAEPGDHSGVNQFEDRSQDYWVVVPESYADLAPLPVMLFIAAGFGVADENFEWWKPYLDESSSLVVIAGAPGIGTEPALPPEVHLALLDKIATDYCIDTQRVHAMGWSSSAAKAARLACNASDRIASFVASMALFQVGCEPEEPVPLMAFTGDDDRLRTTRSVEWWAEHNGCDSEPAVTDLGSGVTLSTYQDCEADVLLYDVKDAGHSAFFHECVGSIRTPGGEFCEQNPVLDQLAEMERFFAEHPLTR